LDIQEIFYAILPKIGLFSENGHYLSQHFIWLLRPRLRARDISSNIDPINLKF
jgi:hypothetical protein